MRQPDDGDSEADDLRAEARAEHRRLMHSLRHPDPRDPEYEGPEDEDEDE